MTTERLYKIDGDQLTLAQICERLPQFGRETIRKRLERGWRTWAELRMSTTAAKAAARKSLYGRWSIKT